MICYILPCYMEQWMACELWLSEYKLCISKVLRRANGKRKPGTELTSEQYNTLIFRSGKSKLIRKPGHTSTESIRVHKRLKDNNDSIELETICPYRRNTTQAPRIILVILAKETFSFDPEGQRENLLQEKSRAEIIRKSINNATFIGSATSNERGNNLIPGYVFHFSW